MLRTSSGAQARSRPRISTTPFSPRRRQFIVRVLDHKGHTQYRPWGPYRHHRAAVAERRPEHAGPHGNNALGQSEISGHDRFWNSGADRQYRLISAFDEAVQYTTSPLGGPAASTADTTKYDLCAHDHRRGERHRIDGTGMSPVRSVIPRSRSRSARPLDAAERGQLRSTARQQRALGPGRVDPRDPCGERPAAAFALRSRAPRDTAQAMPASRARPRHRRLVLSLPSLPGD